MINCVECGRFMGKDDFEHGRCEVEPLSDFGPERIEWTCRSCYEIFARRSATPGSQALATGGGDDE